MYRIRAFLNTNVVSVFGRRKNILDELGNVKSIGTFYIKHIYYERVDNYGNVFKLAKESPRAYMYSHLVKCIKILLSQYKSCPVLYTISVDVYKCIYYAMEFVTILDQNVLCNGTSIVLSTHLFYNTYI